jgi:hypothetical protein
MDSKYIYMSLLQTNDSKVEQYVSILSENEAIAHIALLYTIVYTKFILLCIMHIIKSVILSSSFILYQLTHYDFFFIRLAFKFFKVHTKSSVTLVRSCSKICAFSCCCSCTWASWVGWESALGKREILLAHANDSNRSPQFQGVLFCRWEPIQMRPRGAFFLPPLRMHSASQRAARWVVYLIFFRAVVTKSGTHFLVMTPRAFLRSPSLISFCLRLRAVSGVYLVWRAQGLIIPRARRLMHSPRTFLLWY